jgi:hypothetical protein
MAITAFITPSRGDLNELAADVAAAQRGDACEGVITTLHGRYFAMRAAVATTPSCSAPDTTATMQLVNARFVSLLASG